LFANDKPSIYGVDTATFALKVF